MFILNFNDNIKFSHQDDIKKSFIYHYEEPIFLTIKKLIKIYEKNHDISNRIIVISRPNNYIEPIQNTFQYKNYNYEFSQKLQYNCSCSNNRIYLNSFFQKYNLNKNTKNLTPIYYKYFGDENRVNYNFIPNEEKLICIKEIEVSCDNVYFYTDDTGVLAVISSMINFEVIIMSRDRPEYLQKCLDSVLNQTVKFDSVIISDNSLNNSFTKKIEKKILKV